MSAEQVQPLGYQPRFRLGWANVLSGSAGGRNSWVGKGRSREPRWPRRHGGRGPQLPRAGGCLRSKSSSLVSAAVQVGVGKRLEPRRRRQELLGRVELKLEAKMAETAAGGGLSWTLAEAAAVRLGCLSTTAHRVARSDDALCVAAYSGGCGRQQSAFGCVSSGISPVRRRMVGC